MKTPGRKASQSEISSWAHAGKHMESTAEQPHSLTAPSESRSQEAGLLASIQHDCCWEHLPVEVPLTASLITRAAEDAVHDPHITALQEMKHQRHRSPLSNSPARGERNKHLHELTAVTVGSRYYPGVIQEGFLQHEFCTAPQGLPKDACGCFSFQTCTFGEISGFGNQIVKCWAQEWNLCSGNQETPQELKAEYPRNWSSLMMTCSGSSGQHFLPAIIKRIQNSFL